VAVAAKIARFRDVKAVAQVDSEAPKIQRDAALFEAEIEILSINERKVLGALRGHADDYSSWGSL
jgi:hypothetical protein